MEHGGANSGYTLARMKYEILLASEAIEDLQALEARDRSSVENAMELHLRYEPTKVSRSRIKRLRGMTRPQFRLRVKDFRVFYDVNDDDISVEVLAIVAKENANEWLEKEGEKDEGSGAV
jgi:mRNA-degrading endonuclease RelE of RelBE toxin-antitoxin system